MQSVNRNLGAPPRLWQQDDVRQEHLARSGLASDLQNTRGFHKQLLKMNFNYGNLASADVVELTDQDFDDEVLNSDAPWMVEFYAPW